MVDLTLTALDTPDLPAIRRVLHKHRLAPSGIFLAGSLIDNRPLTFESSYLGPEATSFYGQIFQTEPGPQLCRLVFELAVAGPLLVSVSPGPPHLVVCGDGIDVRDVTDESVPPWLEVVAVVDTPSELERALTGEWGEFRSTFGDRYWG